MNKKAFTLIEIMAVLIILSVIALIAIPNVQKLISGSKDTVSKQQEALIVKAAKAKVAYDMADGTFSMPESVSVKIVSVSALVSEGYIEDKDLQGIDSSACVKITESGNVYNYQFDNSCS